MPISARYPEQGFTLVEMAVVLVIVGLMLGGMLVPISVQMDQQRYYESRKQLEEIKEALMGYAIVNGSLPCPDTTGDGIADAGCSSSATATTGGNVPWVTLGTTNLDPWGQPYRYRVNGAYTATFSFTTPSLVSGNGVIQVCPSNTSCATPLATSVPAVVYSSGKNGAVQPPPDSNLSADELENTTLTTHAKFDRIFVSHDFSNVSGSEFDDIVSWISPSILFNRMVLAEKLP